MTTNELQSGGGSPRGATPSLVRRPVRPLVAAALALAAGSAAAAPGERDGAWAVAAVAAVGAVCAARGLSPACGLALLALAPAGALRAAGGPTARVGTSSPAAIDCASIEAFSGALRRAPGVTTFGDERWRLTADDLRLELPPGLAREGELAAVSSAARGVYPATGPHTDPRARRPFVVLPRADELVRLGPAPDRDPAHGGAHDRAAQDGARVSPDTPPRSLLARLTNELEAARENGLERIAAAGRGASDDGVDPLELEAALLSSAETDLESALLADATPGADEGLPQSHLTASVPHDARRLRDTLTPSAAPNGAQLPHAGLLAALLLGASEDVDFEVGEHFTRTGMRHLLALSGLHVGLVAWLLGRPLARAVHTFCRSIGRALSTLAARLGARSARPRSARARLRSVARALTSESALLAAGALAFVPLAGSGAPAARAAVALALASLADLVGRGAARGRRPDALTLWSTALLLELLARPAAALAVGVQLSYGATLALIVAFRPTLALLRDLVPGRGRLAPVDRRGRRRAALWRVPVERFLGGALGALAVGLVATLATLPITWARFGEWSPLGIVATPLVMPFVTGALAGGYAWLLAPDLAPLALPAWSLELLVRTLAWCDSLPMTPLVLPVVSTDRLVLSVALAIAALVYAGQPHDFVKATADGRGGNGGARNETSRPRRGRRLALALAAGAVLAPMRRTAGAPRGLEFVACDVGRGRAFLLRAPGLGVWLIDGGSHERTGVARRALLPTLRAWGAREVGVVSTSGTRAHGSALPWLVERFEVHTWAGSAPEVIGVAQRRLRDTLRVDVEDGAAEVHRAGARCALTLVRARGAARTLVVRAGDDTLWVLGEGEEGAVDELLARGLLTGAEPSSPPGAVDPAAAAGQRLLVWPAAGVERATGALLDELAPFIVWLGPGVPTDLLAEFARRGVSSASHTTPGGLAHGFDPPP